MYVLYICMHYMCVCVCVCIYVCMYVYTLFIGLPFSKAIQESIKGEFIARLNAFIVDVKAKADAHKEKVQR